MNKTHGLTDAYVPADLVLIDLPGLQCTYLRSEAAAAYTALFAAAEQDGAVLVCCSGYRSYAEQEELYDNAVSVYGAYEAGRTTAPPGYSEHQTGLAMDVISGSTGQDLGVEFIETPEGQWIDQNAWKYGFIVRYPNGKEDITGYSYEPWHIRYIGKDVAKAVYESGKTYEEYLGILD